MGANDYTIPTVKSLIVSIHAPAMGAKSINKNILTNIIVSIHAPAMGAKRQKALKK